MYAETPLEENHATGKCTPRGFVDVVLLLSSIVKALLPRGNGEETLK